jgi:uncharacterized protein DUF3515
VAVLSPALAGCGSVRLHDADVPAAERKACAALVDDLPHRVSEQPRRDTSGGELGAAWGDPAIVLRCGVGTPKGYRATSPCQRVNGVDWFVPEDQVSDQGKDVVLTTVGRKPRIELVVPAEHRPPDAAMVDLAGVIRKDTRVVDPCS